MERNSEMSVSDEVIDDLKRMRRIISSHIPSFTRVSIEIPEVIQKVIQQQATNERILKKTASTHIKNTIQSGQYFGHALNSNHDMEIDMRRQRLTWMNREFPRHLKQNQNQKSFDGKTILQTIDKLRNLNGQNSQIFERQIRSSSFNPTSITNEKDKSERNISSEKVSREFNRKTDNIPAKFCQNTGYIKEEDIQDDSQGFVFLSRQYHQIDDSLENFNENTNDINNQADNSNRHSHHSQSKKKRGKSSDTHQNASKTATNNNIYNQNDKCLIIDNKQNNNLIGQISSNNASRNQKEEEDNKDLPILPNNKQEENGKNNNKKKQKYYSPVRPTTINFGTALELDKDIRKYKESLLQEQIQTEQNQFSQNQQSQQSQRTRSRIYSEDKRFDQNENSSMFPLSNSIMSTNEVSNQFLLAKSLSNVQFSHLKQSRYIDYVNHLQNSYDNANNVSLKDSKLHSTTMTTFNPQQADGDAKYSNLPLNDICKGNLNTSNSSRMIKKEIDFQKILNARGALNKNNNQLLSHSGYFQQEQYVSSAQWQPQDILEIEKKFNCREKAHMNIYQHQFVKKYLTMKKECFSKNNNHNTQSLSQICVNNSYNNALNHSNVNQMSSVLLNQNSDQINRVSLKRLKRDNQLQITNQQQLYVGSNPGKIQYEQIRQSDKFFSNSSANDIPKQTENHNQYLKEIKSFKLLKKIISRNPQQNQSQQMLHKPKTSEQKIQQQSQQYQIPHQKLNELRSYLEQQKQQK